MSKFEQILSFIAVVEEQGFAAAARKKHISTAAISRQVTLLENSVGAQLLQRTTRKLSLTDMGEKYYQQCKRTLCELKEAEDAISESMNEATGELSIMANRYFAINHILPRLSEFKRLNAGLTIHFQLAEKFPNFEKDGIDILFGVSVEGSAELIRRRVTSTRYVMCASPSYLKNAGIPECPADLIKHQYITHSMRTPDHIISFKDDREVRVNPTIRLNDSYAMRECAIAGMGIVNLHDYMVAEAIQAGELVEILSDYQEMQKNIYLYYKQSRYMQPKIRRFIDFFTSHLEK